MYLIDMFMLSLRKYLAYFAHLGPFFSILEFCRIFCNMPKFHSYKIHTVQNFLQKKVLSKILRAQAI